MFSKTNHALMAVSLFMAIGCVGQAVALAESPADGGLSARYLRCEYKVEPVGIDAIRPRLSWEVVSGQRSQKQTAYRIQAASSRDKLANDVGDLWDSGKVASDLTCQIEYAGKPLGSEMSCYWKVMVWDKDGKSSAWSEPAMWTMGLLKDSDWQAMWIGNDAVVAEPDKQTQLAGAKWIWYPEKGENPVQQVSKGTVYFREVMHLSEANAKGEIIITADDQFKVYVNGIEVAQVLIPSRKDWRKFDRVTVTDMLKTGKNVVAFEVTNGGNNPAGLIYQYKVTEKRGGEAVVRTAFSRAGVKCSKQKKEGWTKVAFDDSDWRDAIVAGDYGCQPWGEVESGKLVLTPPSYLRKEFTLDKPIKQAMVYASALGWYELHINGERVGEDYFTPGWTDYDIRVYYQTYDVTNMLQRGENAMGSVLATGWYAGYVAWGLRRAHWGEKPRFMGQLHIKYMDGSEEVIATDGSWQTARGPLLEADILMGETYDARKELSGWDRPGFTDGDWRPVDVTETIKANVQAYPGMLTRVFQEIEPVEITEPKPGRYVYDMGTNFAGVLRLKVKAPAGTKVELRHAERLNPDGTIYTDNLRGARARDTYICKGGGVEIWQPRFTFHGFQYAEISGLPYEPTKDTLRGIELTAATPVVGDFTCSDVQANQLYRNICQTQRANFIEVPTDCPQRDERLGWTGDAQVYIRTATYNTDVAAFFTKWLVDLADAQNEAGAFPHYAPLLKDKSGHGSPAWADAGVICPWTIYRVYNDKRVLERHYDAMKAWVDFCEKNSQGLLRPLEGWQGYGDWLSIRANTPKEVLGTAYFAYSTHLLKKTAAVLDRKEDVKRYGNLFNRIKQAFNGAYVAADGKIKGDTQTVYILALTFDLVDGQKREQAIEHLIHNIRERDWHLSTGFVGTKDLMTTLTEIGRTDVAYRLFHNDTFPSWGFSIKHGATSIWERWDGWTPEKGFQTPNMNSFAHYSFGAVAEWMFKTIGGIDTDGPGYKRIIVRPRPGGKLTEARAGYRSIRGLISTHWTQEDGLFHCRVRIPANTTAQVYLPTLNRRQITESRRPVHESEGVRFVRMGDEQTAVYEVGSGAYEFVSPWQKDARTDITVAANRAHGKGRRPNIVFFLIDDLGWSDLGCYGNTFHETPHIDRLAGQGMRFTNAYAACPVCSPTRASILSGQYPARLGITDFITGHWRPYEKLRVPVNRTQYLPLEIDTPAELLTFAGYVSGAFGKWHLGGRDHYPDRQGFDEMLVHHGPHFRFRTTPPIKTEGGDYLAEVLTDRAERFIEDHQAEPFFLYVQHYAVHIPLQAKQAKIEKYQWKPKPAAGINNPIYAAMVEHVDDSVGRILHKLDELKLAENTVVFFYSDNGGLRQIFTGNGPIVTANAPLRDEKGTLYEGGIREPLIIRWPGKIRPGSVSDAVVTSVDVLPTLLEIAGVERKPGQTVDGESLLPVLTGTGLLEREAVFWHYPHYHHSSPAGAIRMGDWKLLEFFEDGREELYNLKKDIGETTNLAKANPGQTRILRQKLQSWRRRVGAAMPTLNPDFDPERRLVWGTHPDREKK